MTWKPGQPVRLETERFVLESKSRLQATLLTYAWTKDPQVMHPLGYPAGTWTWRSWYRNFRHFNNRRKFFLAIRPKDSRTPIGYEAFETSTAGVALLTVVIGDRNWWGKGVVMEARTAVLDFIFDSCKCQRAWGMPTTRNLPSIFNYQRLGFTKEGVLRRQTIDHATGHLQDHIAFGILAEEWRTRRGQEKAAS